MDPATRRDTTRNTTSRYGSGYHSVAHIVVAHDDSAPPAPHLVHDELAPPPRWPPTDARPAATWPASALATGPPVPPWPRPSIRFEDYPAEVGKREIRVSDAAARIANALHLHLD